MKFRPPRRLLSLAGRFFFSSSFSSSPSCQSLSPSSHYILYIYYVYMCICGVRRVRKMAGRQLSGLCEAAPLDQVGGGVNGLLKKECEV